jgi:hypothetical protein
MQRSERRKGAIAGLPSHVLERQLNDAQRLTLRELERFGLSLAFVRRPMFQPAVGVVRDPGKRGYVVIEADGSINHEPKLDLRN